MPISIHTPVKGVTPLRPLAASRVGYFNPHTREGCDGILLTLMHEQIHFNPHTREGCDVILLMMFM